MRLRTTTQLLLLALLIPATAGQAATITVSSTLDVISDDGLCTLREAVIAANLDLPSGVSGGECSAGSGADVIELPSGTFGFDIAGADEDSSATGDLDIRDDLTIQGIAADTTIVDGNDLDRVFHVQGAAASFADLTVTDGATTGHGGGIYVYASDALVTDCVVSYNSSGKQGGGLHVINGALTVWRSIVEENFSADEGGGVFVSSSATGNFNETAIIDNAASSEGGGLFTWGLLTLDDSTVARNDSTFSGGGIFIESGAVNISGSTISGNFASDDGGGVYNQSGIELMNSTISGNLVGGSGGGVFNDRDAVAKNVTFYGNTASASGGAVYNDDTFAVFNTIIQGSCADLLLVSGGGNLESPGNTCGLIHPSDQAGITSIALNLGSLTFNGGPTQTHFPLFPSAAIDSGLNAQCLDFDQRGVQRPRDGDNDGTADCDTGSVEFSPVIFTDGFESGDTSAWFSTFP